MKFRPTWSELFASRWAAVHTGWPAVGPRSARRQRQGRSGQRGLQGVGHHFRRRHDQPGHRPLLPTVPPCTRWQAERWDFGLDLGPGLGVHLAPAGVWKSIQGVWATPSQASRSTPKGIDVGWRQQLLAVLSSAQYPARAAHPKGVVRASASSVGSSLRSCRARGTAARPQRRRAPARHSSMASLALSHQRAGALKSCAR